MAYNPEEQLTKNFKLKDFLVTETGLPNMPTEGYMYDNIKNIAAPLYQIMYDEIGPFRILSAYRSKDVNNKVTGNYDPNRKISFHETGLSIDMYPTSQSIDDYFGKLLANPNYTNSLYEIALKPSQNALHLTVRPSYEKRETKILMMDKNDNYTAATPEQVANYAKPFLQRAGEWISSVASNFEMPDMSFDLDNLFFSQDDDGNSKIKMGAIAAGTGMLVFLLLLTGKKDK